MKVKQQPNDFYVEELTDLSAGEGGSFAFYRLDKRGWTTPDAVAPTRYRWRLGPHAIAFGGLKDRHAHTVQYLTIHDGPRRGLAQPGLDLTYLGQVDAPYDSRCIRANRFRIALRSLSSEQASKAVNEADQLRH